MRLRLHPAALVLASILIVASANSRPLQGSKIILVSAASSLTDAMKEISGAFSLKHPNVRVRLNFGASGSLEKQVEQGAPVDVFASAGEKEMEELATQGDLLRSSQVFFASNRLALIAPINSKLRRWSDLTSPGVFRIALPKPELVPSGRYGKETLIHRGLWDAVEKKLVYANNVRQALAYVANGDVDAGIVFVSDAAIEGQRVRVVELAKPKSDHEAIVYPAAVVSRSADPDEALTFVKFLKEREAQSILKRYGFSSSH